MATLEKILVDLDFQNEQTAKNLADPVDPQDAVTLAYLNSVTGKFAADFGDGAAKIFVFNHAFNTLDVFVQVYENATGEDVKVSVERTDANNVTVEVKGTAPALGAYRVIIHP